MTIERRPAPKLAGRIHAPNLWTPAQAAVRLGFGEATVERHATQGDLPAIDIAPRGATRQVLRFEPAAIEAWLDQYIERIRA